MVERTGGVGNDLLYGTNGDDVLIGLDGDDSMIAYEGNDLLIDTEGWVTSMNAGRGDDVIVIGNRSFSGTLLGGSGADTLRAGTASLVGLTMSSVEVLEVSGTLTAEPSVLQSFFLIHRAAGDFHSPVRLQLAAGPGGLDLTASTMARTGLRAVMLGGSELGDAVTLGGGHDTAEGFAGDDSLTGGAGDDWIDGGAGNDLLEGGEGQDTLSGDAGDDSLFGGAGDDLLIEVFSGRTAMSGGAGNDVLRLGDARMTGTVTGGTGIDRLEVGLSDLSDLTISEVEILAPSAGVWARAAQFEAFATIEASGPAVLLLRPSGGAVVLDLTEELGTRAARLTGTTEAEDLTTGAGDDRIEGGGGRDTLSGGLGADWVIGGLGNDMLFGGESGDTLIGSYGSDLLYGGAGADFLQDGEMLAGAIFGGEGDDRIEIFGPGTGLVDGGPGVDVLANLSATAGVDMAGLTLLGIEVLETRGQPIRMTAEGFMGLTTIRKGPVPGVVFLWLAPSSQALDLGPRLREEGAVWGSVVIGSIGADTIIGGAGADTIAGGNGDDLISGGLGRNGLTGGNGVNSLTYEAFDRGVQVSLRRGVTDFVGGQDTIAGFRRVLGSAFDDRLEGGAGDNTLLGGAGDDVIAGLAGDDWLEGGDGADRFVFSGEIGVDQILDLGALDVIDLSGLARGVAQPDWLTQEGADTRITLSQGASVLVLGLGPAEVEAAIEW